MKDGWKYKTLGEILKIKHGKGYKGITAIEQKYPIYGSGSDVVGYVDEYLCEADTIILGRKGTIDKPRYMDHRYWNIDTAFSLSPLAGFSAKYIYYYCLTVDWQSLDSGSAKPSLTQALVNGQTIHIPSTLSEQQSIVEYLDSSFAKIDAMKANTEKALVEAKALFQASLKSLLEPKEGWEEKTLKQIGKTQTGTTPSKSDAANYGDYIPFVRPSEINYDGTGAIEYNSALMLSEQGASNGRVFEPCSVFMVCIGATIGKVGFSDREISCNQQINILTPSDFVDYKFAYYYMSTSDFQSQVIKEGTSSQATLPIINKGKWEQLSISYPSLSEQKNIVSILDSILSKVDQLQSNYNKISKECDALKQALLKQIFE